MTDHTNYLGNKRSCLKNRQREVHVSLGDILIPMVEVFKKLPLECAKYRRC
jgi:hypothetical protein